ncbi:hypothetical protein V6N13_017206 [Hibiscus sabdariffa]|uniref:Uncharacterized protein n=1 Tax=Hibiscus sabdariffa TaxID=183260 RepID=A0ABR2CYP3_9ROSI
MYGGGSSSQPAYTDDGGYIPQMDYTSITGSSYHPEQMHGTPPSMQVDDQWFNDEQTPDQPRRIVRPPKRTRPPQGGLVDPTAPFHASSHHRHNQAMCRWRCCLSSTQPSASRGVNGWIQDQAISRW